MKYTTTSLINSFLEHWQYIRKRRPETVRNYELYLLRFKDFLGNRPITQINAATITAYKTWLRTHHFDSQTLGPSTINYHLIALRNWLRYLELCQIKTNIQSQPTLAKHISHPRTKITPDQFRKIINVIQQNHRDQTITRLRDEALVRYLYETGDKIHQAVTLSRSDKAKGGGEWKKIVRRYLQLRHDTVPALWLAHDRAQTQRTKLKPLTQRSAQRIINKYAMMAGLSAITADSFTRKSMS